MNGSEKDAGDSLELDSSTFKRQASGDPVLQPPSAQPLQLSSFRQNLIRQEETIIFALIERAQFERNAAVYDASHPDAISIGGRTLLDHMLREQECSHGLVRRYTSPDENPFFLEASDVTPLLPLVDYPPSIRANKININSKIKSLYFERVIPRITNAGSDSRTFGSSCVADIACLQALSKRIHYGKFIAEAKFQASPEKYTDLIRNNDAAGLMALLTDLPQEERVLNRVEKKASTYGQDLDTADAPPDYKVNPKVIREMYRDIVMPQTKEVQVEYLLQRVDHTAIVCCGPEGSLAHEAALGHFTAPCAHISLLPADRPDLVFSKVSSNEAAYGVVVLESRKDGIQQKVKQLLLQCNLKINAEVVLDSGDAGQIRCLVIAKSAASSSGKDKCCFAFGTSHESGALHQALGAFHTHDINLTSIESLPSPDTSAGFKYDFLVELEGSRDQPAVEAAVKMLEEHATFIRYLGTYQKHELDRGEGKRRKLG